MNVQSLIDVLKTFPADSEVRLTVRWPDCVSESYEQLVVEDSGGGPMLRAMLDPRGMRVYVGIDVVEAVSKGPVKAPDLGQYESPEVAARVHDFYVIHKGLHEPLAYPDFDYQRWIPPRTVSGRYNPYIAEILREKLLHE